MRLLRKVRTLAMLAVSTSLISVSTFAYDIADTYIGSNAHGYGDVIGPDNPYGIQGADVSLNGTLLTITVFTNFAGQAPTDTSFVTGGIGYGDLFLSSLWTPYSTSGCTATGYACDNAANGTSWALGLSLDNRFANPTAGSPGTFTVYDMAAAVSGNNNPGVLLSDDLVHCTVGCYFRNGQPVAVNTSNTGNTATPVTGQWYADAANKDLVFSLNISNTPIMNWSDLALSWAMTCANDIIQGQVSISPPTGQYPPVPEPMTLSLLGLGLIGIKVARRRS